MYQAFIDILRSPDEERIALFSSVAASLETRAENVEKDLYVCWILDFLFNRRQGDPIGLYFKGGTSLSKAYGLIRRFSEDIDIGIYKADLGVPLEADITALPSVNQQQKALANQVDEAARVYISGPLRDLLAKEIAEVEAASGREGCSQSNLATTPIATRTRSIFWFAATGASSTPAAAMSTQRFASKAAPGPIPSRPNPGRSNPILPLKCARGRTSRCTVS
ncbi:hypothetical protein ABIB57_004233 [Devosia sp. UYZn731]